MKKKKTSSSSAFFNPRILLALALGLFGVTLSLFAAGVLPGTATTQPVLKPNGGLKDPLANARMMSAQSAKNDVSPPLREMTTMLTLQPRNCEVKENPPTKIPHTDGPDGALYNLEGPRLALQQPNVPATTLNFEGIDFPGVVCSCNPPDTDGAVGLNQYVQEVNEGLQVFNKSTGASEFGPVAVSSIWSGFGGVCQNAGEGDVIVLYDHFANRWIVSQFAVTGTTVTDECVAVSTSADATGSYYRYDFVLNPTFGANYYDYPKIGIWSDAYYMSFNVFNTAGTSFLGPQPFAIDKNAMLQGNPATIVGPVSPLGGTVGPILPADIDGMTLPPSGAPETYIGFPVAGNYPIYHFHADFGNPPASTFTTFATPAAAAFTQLCATGTNTRSCVPQPGVGIAGAANSTTASGLDGIGDRFMFRAAYRNFGTQASPNESLVGNYTVCATGACGASGTGAGQSGVRWIQLGGVTNGPVTVNQESTYTGQTANTLWRWLGSIAQDNAGDMMLGFSTSAGTTGSAFPSIAYTGRLSTDPLNTMAQGEATMFAGAGSQSTSGNRWGDYSAMSVDPEDDCTFWYTQEYYPAGPSSFNWRTRIGNFAFTQCTPMTAQSVAAVSVYNVADFTSFNPGATVGFTLTVNSSGNTTLNGISYSDPLPSGQGVNWSITTPVAGWAITGSPPSQALAFTPGGGSMASGTSSSVHIQTNTSSTLCGSSSLSHTATVTTTNGGSSFASASMAIDCTNCTPNAWTDNSPQLAVPANIMDQGVAALGTKIYMFTGVSSGALTNATRVYNSGANTWTSLTAYPTSLEGPVAVCDGTQYCYVMGGATVTTTERYDTVANTYTALTGFTTARWEAGAAYFNGKIYLVGGNTASSTTNSLQIGTLSGSPPTVTWAAGATVPVAVGFPQVAYMNVGGVDYIYLAGGTTTAAAQSAVYRYNISTNTWSANLGNMPATIWSAANGVVNGYWVLAGGYVNGNPSNATYSYLPSSNTWTLNASSMAQPRGRGAGAAVSGTSLFSLGGRNDATFNGTNDNQKYTPSLCAPGLVSVVSRQTHGAAGTFDLPLSTTSTVVEPRSTGGNYTIIFNYAVPVNSGTASASGGTGSTGSVTFSGNSMTVPLSGVTDQQRLTVTANGVSGPGSGSTTQGTQIGFLIGDVNGDGSVNIGDTAQVRSNAGVTLDNTNFLNDVNIDGAVNVGDTIIVRGDSGNALP